MRRSVGGVEKNQNFINIYIKIRNYALWIESSSMGNFQEFLMSIRAMINYNAPDTEEF